MYSIFEFGLVILTLVCAGTARVDFSTVNDNSSHCDKQWQEKVLQDDVAMMQTGVKLSRGDSANGRLRTVSHVKAWNSYRQVQDPNTTAEVDLASQTGLSLNHAGDLDVFYASLQFNLECVIFFLLLFLVGKYYFPQIYAFRATGAHLEGKRKEAAQDAPFKWDVSDFSLWEWVYYSFAATRQELIDSSGLDAAMLMASAEMGMEIMAGIGVAFLLVLCPLYYSWGGMAAGDDKLSYLSIGNVEPGSWVFWPVSISTWFVVIFTQRRLFQWMRMFITYREDWLERMSEPQDLTVLVEGIPDDLCSDEFLKEYFEEMFGQESVKEAFVVKKIAHLESLVAQYRRQDRYRKEDLFRMKKRGANKERLQNDLRSRETELERLRNEIKSEQERVAIEANKYPEETDIYATNGFVTFTDKKISEQAINSRLRPADDELVTSHPPEPTDVLWGDLEQTMAGRTFFSTLGYAAVAGLFFAYMPCVIAISQACSLESLEAQFPWFKCWAQDLGEWRDTLAATLASMGLLFMTSFLPTFLMLIFDVCFTLKASRWAQLHLQTYYFWFLILFVLLITSIGGSLSAFLTELAQSPFLIFSILANQMPRTTHFYLNYVAMQWSADAMNMLRYVQVAKYLIFKRVLEPEDARAMSEPEDQDYYGMGARSSRFSLLLVIGLVFSSICPLMMLLVFISFFFCRLFYGYLIAFAEQKKTDLGGAHFALQLIHSHLGLLIYIVMMTGLMSQCAATIWPAVISGTCFVWWVLSFHKFCHKLHWETIPYEDVVRQGDKVPRPCAVTTYQQIALDPEVLDKIDADPFDEENEG